VIVISVIGIDTNSDAAANKGKIVNVPLIGGIQTAVSDGSKWLYCGAGSQFSETPGDYTPGEEDSGRTKCGPAQKAAQSLALTPGSSSWDWSFCLTTVSLTGDIEFDHTGAGCRQKCGELGHLSWGMWSWDGESESTCWCGDGELTKHHCTFRAGTCEESNDIRDCSKGTWFVHFNNYMTISWDKSQLVQLVASRINDQEYYGKYYDHGGYRYTRGMYIQSSSVGTTYEACRRPLNELPDCSKNWDCDDYCKNKEDVRWGSCGDKKCYCLHGSGASSSGKSSSYDEPSTPYLFSYVNGKYLIENDFMNTYFQTDGMTIYDTEQAYKNDDVGTVFSENEIYHIKQKPTVENGKIKLQIKELEPEESKIDQIKLIKVVHDKDTVAFASDTVYGSKSELKNAKLTESEPISCVDNNNEDCLDFVLNEDEDYLVKDNGDFIVLRFKPDIGENYLYINSWINEFVPNLIVDEEGFVKKVVRMVVGVYGVSEPGQAEVDLSDDPTDPSNLGDTAHDTPSLDPSDDPTDPSNLGDTAHDPLGPSVDQCFLPDAPVSLSDGTYKRIDEIKIGDLVKVYNEKTGKIEIAPVKQVNAVYHDNVHEIHLANNKILKPTANHPFLIDGKGWATISGEDELGMGAGKLEIGDFGYVADSEGNLQRVAVIDIIPIEGNYLTYNLIDMKYGTFLVDDVVVHNSDDTGPGPGPGPLGLPEKSFRFSFSKDGRWEKIGQDFHTHALRSGEFRKVDVRNYADGDGYVTLRIEWTAEHILDKISIVNAENKDYRKEELKLLRAKHSRDGDVRKELLEKDFKYAHIVRGDVIDLEFEQGKLKPNNNEIVDYFFESYGFYHGLRTYLYPDVDTSDSYKEEINQYVTELNNYLETKNQYQNPFIK